MKLYELTGMYAQLERVGDEFDEQAVKDTLEGIQGEIEDKADNIASLIKNLMADVKMLKEEADTLTARAKSKQKQIDWYKTYLLDNLSSAGIGKVETARNVISIKKSPAKVMFDDETKFISWATLDHEEFIRQKEPEIDKTSVKEALKNGKEIPGAWLEQGITVTIK